MTTVMPSSAVLRRFPAPASVADTVADSLGFAARRLRERAGRSRTVVLAVPAPAAAPEALLDACSRSPGVLWDDGEAAFAGAGACHRLEVSGAGGVGRLKTAAARLWERLDTVSHKNCRLPPPRLFGGLAFASGAADRGPWREFGDGCFVLPRWLYSPSGAGISAKQAALALAVRGDEVVRHGSRSAILDELEVLLTTLAALAAAPRPADGGRVAAVHAAPRRPWIENVEEIRAAIAAGRFAKIVAAHSSRVEIEGAPSPAAILARLADGQEDEVRFAFRHRQATFLGRTPERLVRRRGREVRTEALAGTAGAGARRSLELLASAKDRHEHQLVVDAIVGRLRPFCGEPRRPASPRLRRLRGLQHLRTPIGGTLDAERHVLDLVAALHPTPAVGGVPTAAATRWIVDHEPEPRGWYAAPVGWFDAAGDGDFAVALRSCLLRPTAAGAEAFVYAGAGIVADSDPEREYAETELKMQTMLPALAPAPPAAPGKSRRDAGASGDPPSRVLSAAHRWHRSTP